MKAIYFLSFVLLSLTVEAQYAKFVASGVVTFEKRANMYELMKKNINKENEIYAQKSYEQYIITQPQFKTSNNTLVFTKNQSLYKPDEDTRPAKSNPFLPAFEQNSLVYADFVKRQSISQKTVFEQTFLVKDSIRNIRWKITDETRNIAGYECRRANALIMDSVYVVAFYTDDILATAGPESFTGLPGMILGVALPHEHITWFATKIVDRPVAVKELNPPTKGTEVNRKIFRASLENSFKGYARYIRDALKFFFL